MKIPGEMYSPCAGAGVDVAECNDDDFRQLVLNTAKYQNLLDDTPPSAAVHQLFSGNATQSNTVSDREG